MKTTITLSLSAAILLATAGCARFPGPLSHWREKRQQRKSEARQIAAATATTSVMHNKSAYDFPSDADADPLALHAGTPLAGRSYATAGDVYIDTTALAEANGFQSSNTPTTPTNDQYPGQSPYWNSANTQTTTNTNGFVIETDQGAMQGSGSTNSASNLQPFQWVDSAPPANAPQNAQPFAQTAAQPVPVQQAQTKAPSPRSVGSIYEQVLEAELPNEAGIMDQRETTANVRQVTFAEAGADFDPQISRDGKYVIYASTQHRETADIYMKTIDGRVVTRLTADPAQDVMPSLSPDSKYLTFTSNRSGSWDIFLMPSAGGKALQLTNEATHDLHPSWSPDGRMVVFSRLGQTSGRWELWVLDVAHPSSVQFIGYGLFPEWCPVAATGFNGADRILFQRSRQRGDRAFGVWTIDYDANQSTAGRETEIVSAVDKAYINPSWSPDGEFILYADVSKDSDNASASSIWMMGNEGNGKVKLIGGASADIMPVWGADGRVIFVSDRSGHENLWSLPIKQAVATANAQRPNATQNNTQPAFATVPTGAGPGE